MKEHIRAAAAFAGVSSAGINLLASAGTWVELTPGETLFHTHDRSRTLYLVAEGRMDVLTRDAAGVETLVGQLGPGDVAGEIQMLTGGRRTAGLRATSAARVIRFFQGDIRAVGGKRGGLPGTCTEPGAGAPAAQPPGLDPTRSVRASTSTRWP